MTLRVYSLVHKKYVEFFGYYFLQSIKISLKNKIFSSFTQVYFSLISKALLNLRVKFINSVQKLAPKYPVHSMKNKAGN